MGRVANPDLTERRRRQIMNAALACFRRRGFHQTSMQEICTEAEMSAGSIYRYFPSKTEIIAGIIREDGENRQSLFDNVRDGEDLIERLVFGAESFVAEILEPGGASLIGDVMAEAMRNPELAARLREGTAPFQAKLIQLIAEYQARGDFEAGIDPAQTGRIVFGAVDGICMRVIVRGADERKNVGEDVRELLNCILRPAPARRTMTVPKRPTSEKRREKV